MAKFQSDMKFNMHGLGEVIANNKLVIPANQREYSWTEDQVEALFQDIAKAVDSSQSYFVGTIVGIPNSDGSKIEIIDGQQRLATTSIFLAEMMRFFVDHDDELLAKSVKDILFSVDRNKREYVPSLALGKVDNDFFINLLQETVDTGREINRPSLIKMETARALAKTQIYSIVSPLSDKDQCNELNQWLNYIERDVKVLLLTVNSSASAYKMFETLNDRGLKTTQSDLVKNYLFGESHDRFDEVEHKWNSMKSILSSISQKDISIDFLRYALTCIVGYTRETDVYEFTEKRVNSPQKSVTFASELESLSHSFSAIKVPDHERWGGSMQSVRSGIRTLIMFNVKPLIPLQMAVEQKFDDKQNKLAIEFFVSLTVRLLIASSTRSGGQINPLANTAHHVYTGKITNVVEMKESLKNIIPTDSEFEEAFSQFKSSKPELSRYYLRGIENAITKKEGAWYVLNEEASEITLEHIYPKKPQGNYPSISDDDSALYLNRLGNQTLLTHSMNSNLKSLPFTQKKEEFSKSPYVLTSDLGSGYGDDWSSKDIDDRQKYMAKWACRAWPI